MGHCSSKNVLYKNIITRKKHVSVWKLCYKIKIKYLEDWLPTFNHWTHQKAHIQSWPLNFKKIWVPASSMKITFFTVCYTSYLLQNHLAFTKTLEKGPSKPTFWEDCVTEFETTSCHYSGINTILKRMKQRWTVLWWSYFFQKFHRKISYFCIFQEFSTIFIFLS